VSLSELVRAAIRAEYDRRIRPSGSRKPSRVVTALLEALPGEAPAHPRPPATDRQAFRALVTAKLKRRRA
jgi:hypothetical protein